MWSGSGRPRGMPQLSSWRRSSAVMISNPFVRGGPSPGCRSASRMVMCLDEDRPRLEIPDDESLMNSARACLPSQWPFVEANLDRYVVPNSSEALTYRDKRHLSRRAGAPLIFLR